LKKLIRAGALIVALAVTAGATPAIAASAAPSTARAAAPAAVAAAPDAAMYSNPLNLVLRDGVNAEQCADPDVIRSQTPGDEAWYLFCTRDALVTGEVDDEGEPVFYSIPSYRSTNLVDWTFQREALPTKPAWIGNGDMWAPDVVFLNGTYHLYYTATNTAANPPGAPAAAAIGVATSTSLAGPWTDSGAPVVEPQAPPGGNPNDKRWVFDPEVLVDGDTAYIYYGSYFGGISVRTLSADGLTSDPASQTEIAISNRYEGVNIVEHDGWYYLLASATNCCNGPLTAYSVFAGRSQSPTGPFVDRTGTSLLAGRVGGTPVLHQNGNRWIGTGHNTVVTDLAGQQWIVYHAVDRTDPWFLDGSYTKRPVLMDPLDWVDGWPVTRGGEGPSDSLQPAPVTTPGQPVGYTPVRASVPQPGAAIPALSDEFDGTALGEQWSWTREPDPAGHAVTGGAFTWRTQQADLNFGDGPAGLVTEAAPGGDYVVETKVAIDLPADGCCQNFVQGGLVIYTDDGHYIKLGVTSIWETRQTEFGKRDEPAPTGTPLPEGTVVYGNTVGGPVGDETYLRLVREHSETENLYTAFTSLDGVLWDEAGTWTTPLEESAAPRIGLVSMAGAGFTTTFDYLRVFELAVDPVMTEPEPAIPAPAAHPTPVVPSGKDALAATGADASPLVAAVLALLLAGLALRLSTTRRARAAERTQG
jgi:arabinan endo-1,5-alpha-L-arabinosidase